MPDVLGPLRRRYVVLALVASLSALPFLPSVFEFAAYLACCAFVLLNTVPAAERAFVISRRRAPLLVAVFLLLVMQCAGLLTDLSHHSYKNLQFVFLLVLACVCVSFPPSVLRKLFATLMLGKLIGGAVTLLATVILGSRAGWLYSPGLDLLFVWALIVTRDAWPSPFTGLLVAGACLVLAATVGSTGDMAVVLALVAYLYAYRGFPVRLAVFAFPLAVVITGIYFYLTFPVPLPEALSQTSLWTLAQRINLWSTAVRMAVENAPVGVGTGEFQRTFLSYWLDRYELRPYAFDLLKIDTPHNQVMLSLAENGVVAAASLVAAFSVIVHRFRERRVMMAQLVLVSYWALFGGDWFYGSNGLLIVVTLLYVLRTVNARQQERSIHANSARHQLA